MPKKGSCRVCGKETFSDCCWFCKDCVKGNLQLGLIELAIDSLERIPGGKLYNPQAMTAIGCLMSLRVTLPNLPGSPTIPPHVQTSSGV